MRGAKDRLRETPLTIRPVVLEDLPSWLALWASYNEFYGRAGSSALAAPVTERTWQKFFEAHEAVHALVADSPRGLVGFAHYLFHASTTSIEPACYMRDLYTDPSVRGRGIATALIEGVCARASADGTPAIYWQTHESNSVARGLYDSIADRSGFIVYRKLSRPAATEES